MSVRMYVCVCVLFLLQDHLADGGSIYLVRKRPVDQIEQTHRNTNVPALCCLCCVVVLVVQLSERRNKPEEIRQLFKQKGFCSEVRSNERMQAARQANRVRVCVQEVIHRRAQNELLNVTRFWRVGSGRAGRECV